VYQVSAKLGGASVPNGGGDNGVSIARMIIITTDSANNIDPANFGFIDAKQGRQITDDSFTFFNLAGTIALPLDVGDRVYMFARASAETIISGDFEIE
jgi:hypothetical protein